MTKITLKEGDAAFVVRANGDTELLLPNENEQGVADDTLVLVAMASKWDDDEFRDEMMEHFGQLSEESDNALIDGDNVFKFPGNITRH